MKKITLKVKGMHCKSCEVVISEALEEAGAKSKIDSKKGIAVIEFDEKSITEDKIRKIIQNEGYTIE